MESRNHPVNASPSIAAPTTGLVLLVLVSLVVPGARAGAKLIPWPCVSGVFHAGTLRPDEWVPWWCPPSR